MARDIVEYEESHLQHRLKLLYPHVNMQVNPMPSRWNETDRSYYLEPTSRDLLTVTYTGMGSGAGYAYAGSIRANHPIPPAARLYYFEVRVLNAGINNQGYIGVGISEAGVSTDRLPGWDPTSYGYHGDDGKFFLSSGIGLTYGPTYTTGDVVGCGLDFVNGRIFFTKNGENLGIACSDISTINLLYPTVGTQTPGSVLVANFGGKPFAYDIDDYYATNDSNMLII